MSRREIAERVGVSYWTVRNHVQSYEAGFDSVGEWEDHVAREQGHESAYGRKIVYLEGRGFASNHDYNVYLAERRGISYEEYRDESAQRRGFDSHNEEERFWSLRREAWN